MRSAALISVPLMNITPISVNHVNISDVTFGSFRAERNEEEMEVQMVDENEGGDVSVVSLPSSSSSSSSLRRSPGCF